MTKREFLIKWKIDKDKNIKLDFENDLIYENIALSSSYSDNFINEIIELLNDYKNIEWDNNSIIYI
ncbi:hypothetical protein [Spiroplasma endosymbiont of Aleiodes alternator]|uniref:hypothetical protein n=1 Tax=Spiroplasma endosymbiont of Aleiodes alternator TaxID=3139329 RepID=UPI003CCAFA50